MLLLVLISVFIFFLLNLLMIYSARKVFYRTINKNQNVNISIVIAARNEINNIELLIAALEKLDYPPDKYEVMIVDDNSTDNTFEKIKSEITSQQNFYVKELETIDKHGKRDALFFGVANAKFSNILITDADCHPQLNWLIACSSRFSEGYDMIFGIAPFYQHKNFVNKISCFENLRSSFLSVCFASIGLAYTATARNFGFTKNSFYSIGGYTQTKDTLSGDDDLLLREAVKKELRIGIVTDPGSFVYSETKKTFKEYLNQKARHTQTSLHYLKKHKLILGFWHILNLLFLFSPLLMFFNLMFGILLPVKLLSDYLVNAFFQKKLDYKFSFAELISLQILYEVFIVIHFFNASFFKIKWK